MYDRFLSPLQALEATLDQVFSRLGEHLQGHPFGHPLIIDQFAGKIEFGLSGGGKTDLDLLEPDRAEQFEQFQLFLHSHGNGQGLITVAQVHAAPLGYAVDGLARPLTVRQIDGPPGLVFGDRALLHEGGDLTLFDRG